MEALKTGKRIAFAQKLYDGPRSKSQAAENSKFAGFGLFRIVFAGFLDKAEKGRGKAAST